jgi:hypothetical protein
MASLREKPLAPFCTVVYVRRNLLQLRLLVARSSFGVGREVDGSFSLQGQRSRKDGDGEAGCGRKVVAVVELYGSTVEE